MAKPSGTATATWGTWEELLLSCAVHRYGTDSWDYVATELQKRIPSPKTLTAHTCKLQYHDLKRRFTNKNNVVSIPATIHNNNNATNTNNNIPWIDELRQLRVAELKREVENYDLSIVSLQLKLKRLKEEKEEGEREAEKTDLQKEALGSERDDDDVKRGEPENVTGGEDSDRENRSVNESNSTDPKTDSQGEAEKGQELVVPVGFDGPDQEGEEDVKIESGGRDGEDLCNSVAGESARNSVRVDPDDTAGSSKGGKECSSSDVQSSASLSRKEEPEEEEDGEKPDEPEERSFDESQPLINFLEILRSHKLGSLFERRLETQESITYKNLVRQHIDFETIRTRLEEGWYSGSNNKKFYRDLLLLINNAIVFFGKNSAESLAAIELRQLVSKERARKSATELLPKEESSGSQDPGPPRSLAIKPKMRVLMIACRKRSSIATKASTLFCGADKKGEQKANLVEEKPVIDLKHPEKSTDKAEQSRVTKKRTRDRFSSGAINSNKNSKSRTSMKTNKNTDANSNTTSSSTKAGSLNENTESKVEKERKTSGTASMKKKGAVNFLDRMKHSSPYNNRSLLASIKQPVNSSYNSKGAQQKRSSNSKGDAKKNQNTRKGSGVKQTREGRRSAKKNVGRPPKRAAAPHAPLVPAKRGRESSGAEAGAPGQAKRRTRR